MKIDPQSIGPLPSNRHRSSRGFTLAEVLLALALLALAAVAVGTSVRASLGLVGRARETEVQRPDARMVLDEFLAIANRQTAEQGGRIQLPGGDTLNWEAKIEEADVPDVFEVHLEIRGSEDDIKRRLFLYRPSWSTAIDRGPLQEDARKEIQDHLQKKGYGP